MSYDEMRRVVDEFRQEPVASSPLIDLIATAIYEANDADNFDIDDELETDGMDWYRREAIQVIEALREAGLDLARDYEVTVNVPLPPVSIRPVVRPKQPFTAGVLGGDHQETVGDYHQKLYGGNND